MIYLVVLWLFLVLFWAFRYNFWFNFWLFDFWDDFLGNFLGNYWDDLWDDDGKLVLLVWVHGWGVGVYHSSIWTFRLRFEYHWLRGSLLLPTTSGLTYWRPQIYVYIGKPDAVYTWLRHIILRVNRLLRWIIISSMIALVVKVVDGAGVHLL